MGKVQSEETKVNFGYAPCVRARGAWAPQSNQVKRINITAK